MKTIPNHKPENHDSVKGNFGLTVEIKKNTFSMLGEQEKHEHVKLTNTLYHYIDVYQVVALPVLTPYQATIMFFLE